MTRNKSRKIFGSLLVIISIIVMSIPTGSLMADDSKTSDFQLNGSLLVKYTGTATTVSVPDTVKTIGQEAFANNSNMTTLKLPKNLETIEYAAFTGCNNLTKVTIPDTVETIGAAAFCNCTSLKEVSIGKKVNKLGTGVFTGDGLLSTVSLSGNDSFICDDGVIYDKSKETIYEVLQGRTKSTYEMPYTVKSIMPYSFYGCSKIGEVVLSPYLTEIPPYAFSFCYGLKNITIPYSVNLIDIKAFENCVNLENVTINENVSYIADSAFDGCGKLTFITSPNSYAAKWFENFDKSNVLNIDFVDNTVSKDTSGNNSSGLSGNDEPVWQTVKVETPIEGQIGETVIVGRQAVFFIDNTVPSVKGTTSHISSTNPNAVNSTQDVSGTEYVLPDNWNISDALTMETNGKGLNLPKFTVIDGLIASKAFYNDSSMTSYEIGEDITSIGDFSFARSGLTSITIPKGVTHIGYGAFYHCDNLATILIPDTVTEIEPAAFSKTRMMENWLKYGDGNFMVVGDGILIAYRGSDSKVVIPDDVKTIGPECFMNHSEIQEIELPDSVVTISEDAFSGCSNLFRVTGGNSLECIEDRAFDNCPIKTVRIQASVTKIGLSSYNEENVNLQDSEKVAVFMGNDIPTLSFNKTATRLYNDDYRKDALSGINVAIINDETIIRTGTVLDREYSGFSGLICVISEENNEYFNGKLKIVDCTLTQDEANSISIPKTVYIYGKGYNFDEEELTSVLSMAMEGQYNPTVKSDEAFSIPGLDEKYVLNIKRDGIKDESVISAYSRIYAEDIPANLTTYTISMYEDTREIPITKLGTDELPVTIILPDNVPTSNLHVICVDSDGQLEDLPYSIVDNDGLSVSFKISHTGKYGLYAFNSSSVSKFNLDPTPDTGDKIHPKWYLGVGLMALGLALILYKKREKVISL